MFLCFESMIYNNEFIYEQEEQEQEQEGQEGQEQEEQDPYEELNTYMEPVKRYHLINQLIRLQHSLRIVNYENEILNRLIDFVDKISYDHLLIIVPKLLELIQKDVKQISHQEKETIV